MMRLKLGPRRDLTCQQAVDLVTDYLEGALTPRQRRRFEAHLAACVHCPEYLAQMRTTITLAGAITPDDLTPQMQADLIGLYRKWHADPSGEADGREK
jgi:anti-sigma factor RsiW